MKQIESYGSMRAAVRELGVDQFVSAILRAARTNGPSNERAGFPAPRARPLQPEARPEHSPRWR